MPTPRPDRRLIAKFITLVLFFTHPANATELVECKIEQVLESKGHIFREQKNDPMIAKRIFLDQKNGKVNYAGRALEGSSVTVDQYGFFGDDPSRHKVWVIRLGYTSAPFQSHTLIIDPWNEVFRLFIPVGFVYSGRCKIAR
jgi:hypothetical protein